MSKKTINDIYTRMIKMCYDPDFFMYNNYGAKGITVCDEWQDKENFKEWAISNGFKSGAKIKRINTLSNFSPSNCVVTDIPPIKKKDENEVPQYKINIEKRERDKKLRLSYGVPYHFSKNELYRRYRGIVSRTCGKNIKGSTGEIYKKYYTDRGIGLCDEWKGREGFYRFYKWSMENGYKEGLSIDRINNDKGYSPDNCRWIPLGMQTRNRRCNVRYDYHGEELLLIEICEKEKISYDALKYRVVKQGQDLDYAVSEIKKHKERMDYLNGDSTNPIGCALRRVREKTGLTQKEFSKKYCIGEKMIQDWESGKAETSKLASYLLSKIVRITDNSLIQKKDA